MIFKTGVCKIEKEKIKKDRWKGRQNEWKEKEETMIMEKWRERNKEKLDMN